MNRVESGRVSAEGQSPLRSGLVLRAAVAMAITGSVVVGVAVLPGATEPEDRIRRRPLPTS